MKFKIINKIFNKKIIMHKPLIKNHNNKINNNHINKETSWEVILVIIKIKKTQVYKFLSVETVKVEVKKENKYNRLKILIILI